MPRVDLQEVAKWLFAAPKIARDTAPFYWTYLEAPHDGQIWLTWQPLQRLGVNMASDGYIWAGSETLYQQEVGNGSVCADTFSSCSAESGVEKPGRERGD